LEGDANDFVAFWIKDRATTVTRIDSYQTKTTN
jgi:hypothetical protein